MLYGSTVNNVTWSKWRVWERHVSTCSSEGIPLPPASVNSTCLSHNGPSRTVCRPANKYLWLHSALRKLMQNNKETEPNKVPLVWVMNCGYPRPTRWFWKAIWTIPLYLQQRKIAQLITCVSDLADADNSLLFCTSCNLFSHCTKKLLQNVSDFSSFNIY